MADNDEYETYKVKGMTYRRLKDPVAREKRRIAAREGRLTDEAKAGEKENQRSIYEMFQDKARQVGNDIKNKAAELGGTGKATADEEALKAGDRLKKKRGY